MAKRETKADSDPFEDELRRFTERASVLVAEDPDSEEEDPRRTTLAALNGGASRLIERLTEQIHRRCSDQKWSSYQKRVACEQLVELAFRSTESIYRLAEEFPQPFREIAEELDHFPCLFPAHVDDLRSVKTLLWNKFNLGKRHPLKIRAEPGRKTFSKKTRVNQLLLDCILSVPELARRQRDLDPDEKKTFKPDCREVAYHVPLVPENAKQWLDIIWELLLIEIPIPEKHPSLRQLGQRPSRRKQRTRYDGTVGEKTQAHNVRASIKAKLGVYLKRMLNDSTANK